MITFGKSIQTRDTSGVYFESDRKWLFEKFEKRPQQLEADEPDQQEAI